MSKHPYPKHVVEAVSDVLSQEFHNAYEIGSFEDLTVYDQEAYKDKAGYLLQALWDVDQPHNLSADEARTIWNHAVNARAGHTESMHQLRLLLAAHAPDWGGTR